jgi:hypothetical protein
MTETEIETFFWSITLLFEGSDKFAYRIPEGPSQDHGDSAKYLVTSNLEDAPSWLNVQPPNMPA